MRLLTLIRFPAFTESPATECERVRAETIMRNNRVFQSLGINATKDILNKTTATKKAMARENSGSLYDPRLLEIVMAVKRVYLIRYLLNSGSLYDFGSVCKKD